MLAMLVLCQLCAFMTDQFEKKNMLVTSAPREGQVSCALS